jgi:hypothetical protein
MRPPTRAAAQPTIRRIARRAGGARAASVVVVVAPQLPFSAAGAAVPAAGPAPPAHWPYDEPLGFGVEPGTKALTDLLKRSLISMVDTVASVFFPHDQHPLRPRYYALLREAGALSTHARTLLGFVFLAHCHRVALPPLEEFLVGKRTVGNAPHRVAFEKAHLLDDASGRYDAVYGVMSARPAAACAVRCARRPFCVLGP